MPRTPRALIAPELLRWARESARISVDDAAKRLRVSPDRVAQWERGHSAPTVAQLRQAARVYKRPLGVFYLPEPPLDFQVLRDFRRLPGTDEGEFSPDLQAELRRAQEQRELFLELLEDFDETPATEFVPVTLLDNPEDAGQALRNLVGVTIAEQSTWRRPHDALNGWTAAIEDKGYLVLQTSGVDVRQMRGFSIQHDVLPVIGLNGSDAPYGKVFTLFHELTHLQLSSAGVCDLHDRGQRHIDRVEVFCNGVAAAALMPRGPFLEFVASRQGPADAGWADDWIVAAARHFGVSREALVRRLMTFHFVSDEFYREKRREYQLAYRMEREGATGFAQYHVLRVRDMGRPFVRAVIRAYDQRIITAADTSRFLGVRLKHLPKMKTVVFGGPR